MKKSELKKMIKEEIKSILKEVGGIVKSGKYKGVRYEEAPPNWEGVYKWFMWMKRTDMKQFIKTKKTMGPEWKKLEVMANKKNWDAKYDPEYEDDLDRTL